MNNERIRLTELRGERSRRTIAETLDITPQMLGAIERGDRTPSLALAKKISDLYKVSIDEIFFTLNRNDVCLGGGAKEVG
ncbi:helix-turn-helix domain-containing protein [Sporosarcina sp. resist]|uniref:helix-turn-helix transcriptional regulator n=1 Tax=Sporosarcina sp. resist TaxID=2762563 RepID=UPI00164D1CDE|nr:helix-turn-helix domain-containing protein [Sporosarcina sp. resist]QNK87791.1 helix-turn-helix domain-containing protein [Sporosarcina sp. resist]